MLIGLKNVFGEEEADRSEADKCKDKTDPFVINNLQSGPILTKCFLRKKNTCIFP